MAKKTAQNGFVQIDYQLRYYLHINPDQLTDEQWAIAIQALKKIREVEAGIKSGNKLSKK